MNKEVTKLYHKSKMADCDYQIKKYENWKRFHESKLKELDRKEE